MLDVGVVNTLKAAGAPVIRKPIDDFGVTGQLAGAVTSPLPKASLVLSSENPSSGFRTLPSSKTIGRGEDPTGKAAQAPRARSNAALFDWLCFGSADAEAHAAAWNEMMRRTPEAHVPVNPRTALWRRINLTTQL